MNYKNKLFGKYEIKIGDEWYKIVGSSEDGYVLYGMSESGEERRIPDWKGKKIKRIQ